jgi:hypothetical protein
MESQKVQDVFTPNDLPKHTYVNRSALRLEEKLQDALLISKMIVSVSGPSKAGKSVLIQKVIDQKRLICISGATIKSPEDIWSQTLQWIGAPAITSKTTGLTVGLEGGGKAGGEAGIPLLAKGKAEAHLAGHIEQDKSRTDEFRRGGLQDVIHEISGSDYIIFIDDFHYIPREIQTDVGRQLKAIIERGVKVCTASVPHRSDDVVRSNPELSGRVNSIKIDYWSEAELRKIGELGFGALNIALTSKMLNNIISEAFGTPQLMQALCLNLCLELNIRQTQLDHKRVRVSEAQFKQAKETTSDWSDYSSVVQYLHSGPKERGTERNEFSLLDGSIGDVYRVILTALCQNPPRLSFSYDEILQRVSSVCVEGKPVGSSINQALIQMDKLSSTLSRSVPIIEWDENVLDIVEPYFLFYLRASKKLDLLRKNQGSKRVNNKK